MHHNCHLRPLRSPVMVPARLWNALGETLCERSLLMLNWHKAGNRGSARAWVLLLPLVQCHTADADVLESTFATVLVALAQQEGRDCTIKHHNSDHRQHILPNHDGYVARPLVKCSQKSQW